MVRSVNSRRCARCAIPQFNKIRYYITYRLFNIIKFVAVIFVVNLPTITLQEFVKLCKQFGKINWKLSHTSKNCERVSVLSKAMQSPFVWNIIEQQCCERSSGFQIKSTNTFSNKVVACERLAHCLRRSWDIYCTMQLLLT